MLHDNLKSTRKNVLANSRELYRMLNGRYPTADQLKVFQGDILRAGWPGPDEAAANADALAKLYGELQAA